MKYLEKNLTLKFDPSRCVSCKKCIEVCPHSVFSIDQGKVSLKNRGSCMECGACKKNCRFGAIEVNSGVGCAEALIYSILTGKKPSCGCSN